MGYLILKDATIPEDYLAAMIFARWMEIQITNDYGNSTNNIFLSKENALKLRDWINENISENHSN